MTKQEAKEWRHALGSMIRHHRTAQELTQQELAQRVGCATASISLWECGEMSMAALQVRAIELALGVDIFKPFLLGANEDGS